MKKSSFTTKYKKILAACTGKVNKEPFKGWDTGEVLFLGASASRRGDYIVINFKFAISLKKENFDFAGITVTSKAGWHYAWAEWPKKAITSGKITPQKATGVHVNQVYPDESFGQLGLGK